jgi:hypothetical protein
VVECNLAKVDVEGSNPFSRSRPGLIFKVLAAGTTISADSHVRSRAFVDAVSVFSHAATARLPAARDQSRLAPLVLKCLDGHTDETMEPVRPNWERDRCASQPSRPRLAVGRQELAVSTKRF